MTLRFHTARTTRLVLVLMLGSAATAAAQQTTRADSTRKPTGSDSMRVRKDAGTKPTTSMPVAKEQTPPPDTTTMTPAPVTAPVAVDTPRVNVDTTARVTTTVSGGEAIPLPPRPPSKRFGNGFYFGLAGGASFPQSDLNTPFTTGYAVEVPIGWDPPGSPVGMRLNLGYGQLKADHDFSYVQPGGSAYLAVKNASVWSSELSAKLNLPFGRTARSAFYAVGGGGAYYFKDYGGDLTVTPVVTPHDSVSNVQTFSASESSTRFGTNLGAGLSFGIMPGTSLYIESRYTWVFAKNDRNANFVPLVLGLTFH